MKTIALFLQIRDLFNGNFTWHGFFLLFLFLLMGCIAIGMAGFVSYKAFQPKRKKKDDA